MQSAEEVRKFIAAGGYGRVYEAYDRFTDQLVAVKFLCTSPKVPPDNPVQQRFEREAKVLGQLRHENIVTLFDIEGIREGPP